MKKYTLLYLLFFVCFGGIVTGQTNRESRAKKVIRSERSRTKVSEDLFLKNQSSDVKVILSEDFSKFTAGSEAVPDATEISDFETGLIPVSYMQTFGWVGAGIFQAGGTCYIDMVEYAEGEDTGFLDTPYIDLSGNNGNLTVKFRAKSKSSTGDGLVIGRFNFNDEDMEWGEVELTSEWQQFSIDLAGGTTDSALEFYALESECYIDDIEVIQTTEAGTELPAPVAKPATNVTATSFTANWEAVAGATHYLLSVYYYETTKSGRLKAEGTKVYYLQDEEINATECTVEQLNKDIQYYYTVKATDGTNVSLESAEIEVVKESDVIEAVRLLPASDVTATSFTANWEGNAAKSYWLYIIETFTAKTDGVYTVINEDFNKITQGTVANPVVGALEQSLEGYTESQGWESMYPLFAKGMLGLSATRSALSSAIFSPRMDLSGNDGKFTLEINASSANGDVLKVLKGCTDASHTEPKDIKELTFDAATKNFQVEFTHQNPLSIGGIDLMFETTGAKTFMDDLRITKTLKAGDQYSYIYYAVIPKNGSGVQSVPVELEPKDGYTYSYSVVTLRGLDVEPYMEFLGYENRMKVDFKGNSIESNVADNNKIYVSGNDLHVDLEESSLIEVYTVSGKQIYRANGQSGENVFPLTDQGVYLVKTGNKVVKVIR
ncbi:MAG: hypothetical protein ACLVKO_01660 [Dysgonomonas sp.]